MKASQADGQYVDLLRVATPATPSKADILYQIMGTLSRKNAVKLAVLWDMENLQVRLLTIDGNLHIIKLL